MAIAEAKCRVFDNPNDLTAFLVTTATAVLSIVVDNSGKYILFYT